MLKCTTGGPWGTLPRGAIPEPVSDCRALGARPPENKVYLHLPDSEQALERDVESEWGGLPDDVSGFSQ